MPHTAHIPATQSPLHLQLEPLTQQAFQAFGTVTQNLIRPTSSSLNPNQLAGIEEDLRREGKLVDANQGTARKFIDVVDMSSRYGEAASGTEARVRVSMFACKGRKLRSQTEERGDEAMETSVAGRAVVPSSWNTLSEKAKQQGPFEDIWKNSRQTQSGYNKPTRYYIDIPVLERHPYTPQTFIPLGLDAASTHSCYVVVVAPNSIDSSSGSSNRERPPDLAQARAFLGHGGQAVTYGPGTWHAPMVVIGTGIDFMVVQWGNSVADEDCQEVSTEDPNSAGRKFAVIVDLKDEDGARISSFKTRL